MPRPREFSWAFRKLACHQDGWSIQCNPHHQPTRLKRQANTHSRQQGIDCETSPPPRPGDTPSHQDCYQAWKRWGQLAQGAGCSKVLPAEETGWVGVLKKLQTVGLRD